MNIDLTLFGIAYIIGLIIPGVFFKRFYYQGHFKKQFRSGLFADRMLTNIFWGIVVQLITFWIFSGANGLDKNSIVLRVAKSLDDYSSDKIVDVSWKDILGMQYYFILSILVSIGLGCLLHHLVRILKLDLRISIFQFSNRWHYRFKGESFGDIKSSGQKGRKVHNTIVDLYLNNPSGDCTIIKGVVVDYDVDREGDLRYIYLDRAYKYDEGTKVFDQIKGDRLLVKFSEIKDINFRYVFQSINKDNWRKNFARVITAILIIALGYAISFPWSMDMTLRHKFMAVVCAIMIWFSVSALSLNWFIPKKENRMSLHQIILMVCIIITFSLFLAATIEIDSFRVWIYDLIKKK